MKIIKIVFNIAFLGIFLNCYCQQNNKLLSNSFLVVSSKDFLNFDIENDLPFHFISFQDFGKGQVIQRYTGGNFRDYRLISINYRIEKDSLYIAVENLLNFNHIYKIEKQSDNEIILENGGNRYLLKKVVDVEADNFYFSNDTIQFDSASPIFVELFAYFNRKIPSDLLKDSSYLVNVEFTLKKNKEIYNIRVDTPDSSINKAIEEIIKKSARKWEEFGFRNVKKRDTKISFIVYVKSKEIDNLNFKSADFLVKYLFEQATDAYNAGNYILAKKIFKECEKIYHSYTSILNYTAGIETNEYLVVKNLGINSIINLAAIYYQKGDLDEACRKWKSILHSDDEAINNYKNNCLK